MTTMLRKFCHVELGRDEGVGEGVVEQLAGDAPVVIMVGLRACPKGLAGGGQGVASAGQGVTEGLEIDEAAVVAGFRTSELDQGSVSVDGHHPNPGVLELGAVPAPAVFVVDEREDEPLLVLGRGGADGQPREVEGEVEADGGGLAIEYQVVEGLAELLYQLVLDLQASRHSHLPLGEPDSIEHGQKGVAAPCLESEPFRARESVLVGEADQAGHLMLIAPPVGAEHDREADREALRGVDSGLAVEDQGETRPVLNPGTTIPRARPSNELQAGIGLRLLKSLGVAPQGERLAVGLTISCHRSVVVHPYGPSHPSVSHHRGPTCTRSAPSSLSRNSGIQPTVRSRIRRSTSSQPRREAAALRSGLPSGLRSVSRGHASWRSESTAWSLAGIGTATGWLARPAGW